MNDSSKLSIDEEIVSKSDGFNKSSKFSFRNALKSVHALGSKLYEDANQKSHESMQEVEQNRPTVLRKRSSLAKEYIPLGSIIDNSYIQKKELNRLHFEHLFLASQNDSSLNRTVFKHSYTTKEIRFYIPTFIRFHLIKLHSEDLKNITHIDNKNSLIVYINVYSKGLPKLILEKLTKKDPEGQRSQDAELIFRANRHLFSAKYYTSYNDYLIFMFNPFSEEMVEFEIMKNVIYAPFQEAELILNIRINKKIFKLEHNKTLKIRKNGDALMGGEEPETHVLNFNKIILEFKLEKPKKVTDMFRFHKSIEFGNYGIMTNAINIHIGTYEPPEKIGLTSTQENEDDQLVESHLREELMHEAQLEDISSMRLSIGLYKHPVTELCTFFIPLMLSGGLTLLMFNMCDHDLSNELEVLAIILVAYGAFIPEFRERLSMSRTVIALDFFILYNMIPAILCAFQSITESRTGQSYNSFHIVSMVIYYISALVLMMVYLIYLYVDTRFYRRNVKEMVKNFDTLIFEEGLFEDNPKQNLNWFELKPGENAYFCQKQLTKEQIAKEHQRRTFKKRSTLFTSMVKVLNYKDRDKESENSSQNETPGLTLELKYSDHSNRKMAEIDESSDEEEQLEHQDYLYRNKAIENERHTHTFEKIIGWKQAICIVLVILVLLTLTLFASWDFIHYLYNFEDRNRNCIHDHVERAQDMKEDAIQEAQQKIEDLLVLNQHLRQKLQHQEQSQIGLQQAVAPPDPKNTAIGPKQSLTHEHRLHLRHKINF